VLSHKESQEYIGEQKKDTRKELLTSISIFMTTLGLIVLAECGTFRVATTVFIYLKQIYFKQVLKNIEKSTEKY
jgi:hypothetical protein